MENASLWVNTKEYLGWISQSLQQRSPRKVLVAASAPLINGTPHTPPRSVTRAAPSLPLEASLSRSSPSQASSPLKSSHTATAAKTLSKHKRKRQSSVISISSDDSDRAGLPPVAPSSPPTVQHAVSSPAAVPPSSPVEPAPSAPRPSKRQQKKKARKDRALIRITRLTTCSELRHVTELPFCWDVPDHDGGIVAYLVDLKDNPVAPQ